MDRTISQLSKNQIFDGMIMSLILSLKKNLFQLLFPNLCLEVGLILIFFY